jgi:hypothetical protein
MQEDFLQYLWKYGLYPSNRLLTSDGQPVSVLSAGQLNTDAGPDFLMARIRIAENLWAGHVEVHVKASDWYRHKHNGDPAYEPVILHVVYEADCEVRRENGDRVPTIVLPVKRAYLDNYHRILSTISPVPCEDSWKKLDPREVENWLVNMGIERMQAKSADVFARLERNKGGWEETWNQQITRTFGFGINQESFDRLGQSVPAASIRSTASNVFRLEAILFGQAGLIPVRKPDPYTRALAAEYGFARHKFNLVPVENPGWKFLRMRPSNFPTVRIAQLASFLAANRDHRCTSHPADLRTTELVFDEPVSGYWKLHYDFGKVWSGRFTGFGNGTLNLFMINAILPFRACFAHRSGDAGSWVKWMEILETLPAEDNKITRLWEGYGYRVPNAFYSQAFLHLYHRYCQERNCLACHIGQLLIRGRPG